jgi:hypothetical protein
MFLAYRAMGFAHEERARSICLSTCLLQTCRYRFSAWPLAASQSLEQFLLQGIPAVIHIFVWLRNGDKDPCCL